MQQCRFVMDRVGFVFAGEMNGLSSLTIVGALARSVIKPFVGRTTKTVMLMAGSLPDIEIRLELVGWP